jgi:hypothetical protein
MNARIDLVYNIRKGTFMVGSHDLVNKMHDKAIIINAQNEFMIQIIGYVCTTWPALI